MNKERKREMNKQELLKLALGILSGRINIESLTPDDYDLLGYDSYKIREIGKPDRDLILNEIEDIVFSTIINDVALVKEELQEGLAKNEYAQQIVERILKLNLAIKTGTLKNE